MIIHKPKHLLPDGGATALCFEAGRRIDESKQGWAIADSSVTCKKCLRILKDRGDFSNELAKIKERTK